jgi:hypothetical protein
MDGYLGYGLLSSVAQARALNFSKLQWIRNKSTSPSCGIIYQQFFFLFGNALIIFF